MNAQFYDGNGKQEGVLNSTRVLEETIILAVGLICVWASIRKYRRDPEGSES